MVEGAGAKADGGRLWLAEWRRDEREQTLSVDGAAWWVVVEGHAVVHAGCMQPCVQPFI